MPEDFPFAALQASTDQYGAGLRDLAEANPKLARVAKVMAQMIAEQYPAADGRAVIAAAQAATAAVALVRHLGEGELDAQGIINLVFLAGMAVNAADSPEVPE